MLEFSKKITHDDVERNMKMFFDEHMAMYNIICNYNIGIEISATADEASIIYRVVPQESCDVDKLMAVLSNATVSIYQHCYDINISQDKKNNVLIISLKDKASSAC